MLWTEGFAQASAAELTADVPPDQWMRLSAGDGAKGPRVYDWARIPVRPIKEPGKGYWLLARRSIEKPDELACYACCAPDQTPLEELVRIAGRRWVIEEGFEEAKGEVGLDHYEVRKWEGWYRHITLALLAHAYLAVVRSQALKKGGCFRGVAASDTARGQAPDRSHRLGAPSSRRSCPGMVSLEATASGACQTLPLQTTITIDHSCATVVLGPVDVF